jgi:CheY-like chemotaxis protein
MGLQRIDKVHVALGDGNVQSRAIIKRALKDAGADTVTDVGTVDALVKTLDDINIDLVLADAEMTGGDICEVVQRVRNQSLGRNPFVAVIAPTAAAGCATRNVTPSFRSRFPTRCGPRPWARRAAPRSRR